MKRKEPIQDLEGLTRTAGDIPGKPMFQYCTCGEYLRRYETEPNRRAIQKTLGHYFNTYAAHDDDATAQEPYHDRYTHSTEHHRWERTPGHHGE